MNKGLLAAGEAFMKPDTVILDGEVKMVPCEELFKLVASELKTKDPQETEVDEILEQNQVSDEKGK